MKESNLFKYFMQLGPPLNIDFTESSVGWHVHYVYGPVSQGEKNWVYKYPLVLEMSSDD